MTKFYMSPKYLGMWLHQNNAETSDGADGCLLDNFLVETKRGYAGIYEHYLNGWSSDYYVEFQTGEASEVFKNWHAFYEAYQELTA